MKRFTILSSLILILSLVLGACASGNNEANENLEGTPSGLENGGLDNNANGALATPAANDNGGVIATALPTSTKAVEATPMATVAATVAATTVATTTTGTTGALLEDDSPAKASNLLDYDVRNFQEEKIGEVADMVVDPKTEQISYVVIEFGGFLGLGETKVAVPFSQLTLPAAAALGTSANANDNANANGNDNGNANTSTFEDQRAFYLNIDKETLGNAPTFDVDRTDFNVTTWDEKIRSFWADIKSGITPSSNDNANSNTSTTEVTGTETMTGTTGAETRVAGAPANVVLMTVLLNSAVYNKAGATTTGASNSNANGNANANANDGGLYSNDNSNGNANTNTAVMAGTDKLGDVKEVIVDPRSGQVQYVVVDPDDNLNVGEVWIPVPLKSLTVVYGEGNDYALQIDNQMLSQAPNFEVGKLPAFVQGWDAGLRSYWTTQ